MGEIIDLGKIILVSCEVLINCLYIDVVINIRWVVVIIVVRFVMTVN